MRITTIVEDEALEGSGLAGRFGLSLHLDTQGRRILFDCGPDEACLSNAARLGVSLEKLDAIVLSHAHYDHTGGLAALLERNPTTPVYLLPSCQRPCYSRMPDASLRFIGIDDALWQRLQPRLSPVTSDVQLFDGVFLRLPQIQTTFWPKSNASLLQRAADGSVAPDDFAHELMLVVKERDRGVLFTGCAHHGVTNMLTTARYHHPDVSRWTLVGGFHLVNPRTKAMAEDAETVRHLATELAAAGVEQIITGHCTGSQALQILREELGDRVQELHSGSVFDWRSPALA